MADNVAITPGSGATVAADDIGGVLHQRVKVSIGADGSAADLAFGGALAAASLPATIATDDPLQAKLGIVTETAPASDTASSGLNGRLQRVAQRLTSLIALLPTALGQGTMAQSLKVVVASDQSSIPVTAANTSSRKSVDITRPANATAYTALDCLGATAAAFALTSFGTAGVSYMITQAELRIDVAAIPSGMVGFRVHLYNVTPPSAPADNAAFDLPSGDRTAYLGYLDISAPNDLGATLFCQDLNVGKQITLSGTSLFCVIQTLGAFTPAGNSEVYNLALTRIEV